MYRGEDRRRRWKGRILVKLGGTVKKVWEKVKVPGHADEVLQAVKDLNNS